MRCCKLIHFLCNTLFRQLFLSAAFGFFFFNQKDLYNLEHCCIGKIQRRTFLNFWLIFGRRKNVPSVTYHLKPITYPNTLGNLFPILSYLEICSPCWVIWWRPDSYVSIHEGLQPRAILPRQILLNMTLLTIINMTLFGCTFAVTTIWSIDNFLAFVLGFCVASGCWVLSIHGWEGRVWDPILEFTYFRLISPFNGRTH